MILAPAVQAKFDQMSRYIHRLLREGKPAEGEFKINPLAQDVTKRLVYRVTLDNPEIPDGAD